MMKQIKQKFQMIGILAFCVLSTTLLIAKEERPPMSEVSNSLTLYYSPSCPYCTKVTHFMEDNGITLEKKNTNKPAIRAELIEIGGKGQVPCLVHNGKPLYESTDIINWLAQNEISSNSPHPIDD